MGLPQGKCGRCKTADLSSPTAYGYCYSCAIIVHEELDRAFPFDVFGGDGCLIESFKTKTEADDFAYNMRHCYVEEKTF